MSDRGQERESPDVVVIGGGPAGSTVSTLIAQQGYKVQLFEREKFPRFHIGESLIPETYWVLKRLNMLPKMQQSHFTRKYSVQFVNANGRLSAPFYFWDNKPHECSQTWQVVRSEFDQMMLENAREHGVEAHEATRVVDVLFEGERAVGVRVRAADGSEREVRAKVVVDASGQTGVLQHRLKLRVWDPMLNKGAVWTYWENARRDTGRDEGATLVLQNTTRNGWFWYIPLHDNIVSIGIVAPFDYLFKNRTSHEQTYNEEVDRCPAVKERISAGEARHGLFRHARLLVPGHDRGRRRLGARRRRVRVPRSALLFRRPARAPIGRDGRRRHRRGPREGRHLGRATWKVGAGVQRGRGPHPPSRVRVLRRLQLRKVRPGVSGPAGNGHGSPDRRLLHRSRRQGVGADGDALRARQAAHPLMERGHAGRDGDSQGERAGAAGRPEAVGARLYWLAVVGHGAPWFIF